LQLTQCEIHDNRACDRKTFINLLSHTPQDDFLFPSKLFFIANQVHAKLQITNYTTHQKSSNDLGKLICVEVEGDFKLVMVQEREAYLNSVHCCYFGHVPNRVLLVGSLVSKNFLFCLVGR
jgi:hypothetical protein